MSRHGRKFLSARGKVDRLREYPANEAVALVKQLSRASFDESVEVHIRTGLNVRHADEQLRGTIALPHGLGKSVSVAVFAVGDKAREAEEAGADVVGSDDLAKRIQEGFSDFDIAIATPDQMPLVGRLGRILGPQGKMPNPKVGTVTVDVRKAVEEAKAGKVEYRTDRTAIVHLTIGKVSFPTDQLQENLAAVVDEVVRARPSAAKGRYIRSITIASTMGPGVRIDQARVREGVEEGVPAAA
ncbi:MAG: 50S ribosomal protein L1 [Solirubrobacteraceae bacterium]|nr:50S ribosomal protein L1 [Solirubrobacteraceae bacterium]